MSGYVQCMKINRKCKICGTSFVAIKHTQYFCKRKCFKKDYYQRTKVKAAALKNKRPDYNCPHCGMATPLAFDPVKFPKLFNELICPFCGIPRQVLYDHRFDLSFTIGNPGTIQFVVSSAIVSIGTALSGLDIQR